MGIKLIDKINAEQTAGLKEKNYPEFRTGDIVRVSIKIKEGDKFRIQDFEGKVLAIDNGRKGVAGNFTVSRANLDSIFKSRDITWPTKVRLVKAANFLVRPASS